MLAHKAITAAPVHSAVDRREDAGGRSIASTLARAPVPVKVICAEAAGAFDASAARAIALATTW